MENNRFKEKSVTLAAVKKDIDGLRKEVGELKVSRETIQGQLRKDMVVERVDRIDGEASRGQLVDATAAPTPAKTQPVVATTARGGVTAENGSAFSLDNAARIPKRDTDTRDGM